MTISIDNTGGIIGIRGTVGDTEDNEEKLFTAVMLAINEEATKYSSPAITISHTGENQARTEYFVIISPRSW